MSSQKPRAAQLAAPSLFSFDFREESIQVGDIVRQSWPWILCDRGNQLMPFWQVHGRSGDAQFLCRAVPFTTGCGETWWFKERDVVRTGRSWRVPSHHEVQMWFQDLGTTEFAARLNSRPPATTHPEEAELVMLLAGLGPTRIPYGDRHFYALFPKKQAAR
ncbi:hypothetical protein [Deinococcus sp. QL22]|uniref:hypothetical protein n=1 Tax=Deinococcus sp. QL22 TaxID=2939437 RepID=UPI0020177D59|nr:hypothetical protein [Deinococcus sp. QL22]UQN10303.1 hypothetical protein M1R55_29570 [Deinococcus sp. QL22]UQN10437.1 hypothetical protein M1R55_28895 [Deinococcus sp. QL22]